MIPIQEYNYYLFRLLINSNLPKCSLDLKLCCLRGVSKFSERERELS
jgi:hypothetical protein